MKVTANVTDRCNLACDYCYTPIARSDMARETLFEIVDWAVSSTPPGDTLEFGFFGGEPLLRLDLIGEAARRALEHCRVAGVPLQLQVTTNGTLLDDATVAFLTDCDFRVCVSIDGSPEVHDRHRRFRDGGRSAEAAANGLARALTRLERVQINAVYGPDTLADLPETTAYLANLGGRLLHLNLDISARWPAAVFAIFWDVYSLIADLAIANYEARLPIIVNLIDNKILLFLKDGYGPEDRCGMGTTKVGFSTNGKMYPCERLIGSGSDARLCFGSTQSGSNPRRLASIQERTGNRNSECATCPLRRFCMNWCGCTNYHLTGATNTAAPVLCANERAAIAAAQRTMSSLSRNDQFIRHLTTYLREGSCPRKGERT